MQHSEAFSLFHSWYRNVVPSDVINNYVKYTRVIPSLRVAYVRKHNRPVYWPVIALLLLLAASLVPAVVTIRRKYK